MNEVGQATASSLSIFHLLFQLSHYPHIKLPTHTLAIAKTALVWQCSDITEQKYCSHLLEGNFFLCQLMLLVRVVKVRSPYMSLIIYELNCSYVACFFSWSGVTEEPQEINRFVCSVFDWSLLGNGGQVTPGFISSSDETWLKKTAATICRWEHWLFVFHVWLRIFSLV